MYSVVDDKKGIPLVIYILGVRFSEVVVLLHLKKIYKFTSSSVVP